MADINHIHGDSFSITGRFTGGIDMTGWTGRSQIRTKNDDALVAELTFTWINASSGSFMVRALDTKTWPLEVLRFDVQATSPSDFVISSPALEIQIIKDVTRDG